MTITDDQLRAYLLLTGWTEHGDMSGIWEQEDATGIWALSTDSGGAVAVLSDFEQRPEADIVRDIGRTMPMARGGVA